MIHYFIIIYHNYLSPFLLKSYHNGDIFLNLSIIGGNSFNNFSTSSSVDAAPKVVLKEPCAFSCGNPMANNTCEGSKEPDVQALPLDAQIPSKSNDKRIDSPSINSKLILEFPGNLLSPLGPLI